MRVVGAGIMPDPFVVLGVNVWMIRMAFLVVQLMLAIERRLRGHARIHGNRTVSGDMSLANGRGLIILRKSGYAN
jgi:hypothetical protein